MRLNKYLTEKWKKSFKDRNSFGKLTGKIIEVFVNPTKSEFRDAAGNASFDAIRGKYVRFFADIENRKVYIWDPEAIHIDVWKQIGDGRSYSSTTLLSGAAQMKGGKWKMIDSDEGVRGNLWDYSVEDWEWANKWINVTDYMQDIKEKFNL